MACGFLVPCHASQPPSPEHNELGHGHCGCRQHRAPRGIVSLHMDSASQSLPVMATRLQWSESQQSWASRQGQTAPGCWTTTPTPGIRKGNLPSPGPTRTKEVVPKTTQRGTLSRGFRPLAYIPPPPPLFLQQKKALGGREICPRLHGKEEELKYPPGALTSGRANCTDLL